MGRKIQIEKEQILEAGLRIIIRDGYSAVSVKSVALELGTSTTPITWTFDNIDNYRRELRAYTKDYLNKKMTGDGKDIACEHRNTGNIYIDMAIDEPNVIRYLRSDETDLQTSGGIDFIFDKEKVALTRKDWAKALNISEEQAASFMQFVVVYTEGIVSLILSNVIKPTKEGAHKMLDRASEAYIIYLKTGTIK